MDKRAKLSPAQRSKNSFQGLIDCFGTRVEDLRNQNKYCTEEELRLKRAVAILEKVGDICDCRHVFHRPVVIRHIEKIAWEISCASHSDEVSELAINQLVQYLQLCKITG